MLPNGKQINLLKQSQPNLIWQTSQQSFHSLRKSSPYPPYEKNIIEVFFEHTGRLLIIGEPGSGKTITLLEIAKYLVNKAQNDLSAPIPVRFSLSFWENQNIEEWLVSELEKHYSITPENALHLLHNSKIIPLLDDLDQVDISRQRKCITAINSFLSSQSRPDYLIVCSCINGYISNPSLKLNGAIYLHPLTEVQIHNYLVDIGRSKLWIHIQDSPNILELIKNPLFLSIMLMLDEENSTIEIWTRFYDDKLECLRFLFDRYIQQKLEEDKIIRNEKAKLWLKKIATDFTNKNNNYLFIEKIQPNVLLTQKNHRIIYHSMITLIVGIITYPIILLIYIPLTDSVVRLILLPILSMIFGFIISVLNPDIKPVETLKMPFKEILDALRYANIKDRLLGAFVANFRSFYERIDDLIPMSSIWQASSINSVLKTCFTGIVGFFMAPTAALRESLVGLRGEIIDLEEIKVVNQGIKKSAVNGFLVALIYGVSLFMLGCFFGLLGSELGSEKTMKAYELISFGKSFGLLGMLFGGLFGGLLACIQHFTLRIIIAFYGDMPWRYVRFINYATKQRFLKREGGRYRFIHPLLQKHFGTIDTR
ncbi:hypothetical protein Cri9333_4803 (plasmid) [Crinalium epipsammum PCC 9333]|uniref:NACHT domain-containing protein n=1 Tax=Crinalium epipsammum PCC 9333 TaxID=1173022 RepID=K9W5G5_9CYAN|nr:ATP-binding protein [Crinalium epipsammum]AFZ15573.1 hypothetical protein Cri9333_4803 [Crinalium epipsammum PCC 9333]